MADSCCAFWSNTKNVKINTCAECASTNKTYDTSVLLELVSNCSQWTNMYDGPLCSEGWFENTYLYDCGGDTSLEVHITSDIDTVILKYAIWGVAPTEEDILANEISREFVSAGIEKSLSHNSDYYIYFRVIPGYLDGQDIIGSGETGTVVVDIRITGGG